MIKYSLVFTILIAMSVVGAEETELPQEILDCLNEIKPMFTVYFQCSTMYMLNVPDNTGKNSNLGKKCEKLISDIDDVAKPCKPKFDALNIDQKQKVNSIADGWMKEQTELTEEILHCIIEIKPLAIKYFQCLAKYNNDPKSTDEEAECDKLKLDMDEQIKPCEQNIKARNYYEEQILNIIVEGWKESIKTK